MKPTRVLRAAALVLPSSLTVTALGLVKNILAADYFGTSGAMDAYLLALLLPDMAMQVARTGAFNFIPIFAAERTRSEADAWRAASRMLTYWLLLLLGALGLVLILSSRVTGLLAPGLDAAGHAQMLGFTRVLTLMAVAVGLSRLLAVTLHAQREFLAVALSEVAFQLVSTAYLVVFHGWGIQALVVGQICGGFAQLAVVSAGLHKKRRLLRLDLDLKSDPVRQTIGLAVPVYVGALGDRVNLVISRAFASLLPAGAVSSLQYAQTVAGAVPEVLAGSLTTSLFPFLSEQFARGDRKESATSLRRAMVTTGIVFFPLAAFIGLMARILVWVLFEHGSFDAASTDLTVTALRVFAPGCFAIALNALLGTAFQAGHDTVTPMKAGLVRVAANIALCLVLVPMLGYRGVAMATTLALYLKLLVLLVALRGLLEPRDLREIAAVWARVLLAVGVMVGLMLPLLTFAKHRDLPRWVEVLSLGTLALEGGAAYLAGLFLFCRGELRLHLGLLEGLLGRNRLFASRPVSP
ncbi:MAG TPA: oligosaccharide flippase family protein [Vicinamibacteria bacterium]|nr:oligosaccharide flippase family protein [Vicinamibacteria bacterium]